MASNNSQNALYWMGSAKLLLFGVLPKEAEVEAIWRLKETGYQDIKETGYDSFITTSGTYDPMARTA